MTAVVVARSVADFRTCGKDIPADLAILPCALCGQEITVSPRGVAILAREALAAMALCNPCAIAAAKPGDAVVDVGPIAAAQLARNAQARAVHDFILARTKK